ncbi:MAG: aminoglycoside phosphotransferase family protein, partial [Gammaproteobacteria bacterium]|nr:aminoglycoside phosphotransferase family protein [Gammaproteobacteria bacterium]
MRSIRQKGGGLTNFVFEVGHARGEWVVRINPDRRKLAAYLKERRAVGRARAAGVPTARILEIGNRLVPCAYMILERIRGRNATLHPAREAILRDLGGYAARINRIRTRGFGSTFGWSKAPPGCSRTWRGYLHGELQLEQRLRLFRQHRLLAPRKVESLRALLEGAAPRHTALNHGDLRLKNTLVDARGKIVAIIDWENCTSS